MKKYNFYWNRILLGVLEIDEHNQYRYQKDMHNQLEASKSGMVTYFLPDSQDFGEPISFFEKRLKNANGEEKVIRYFTDEFWLEKV